jgi:hypothetical protein
MLRSRKVFKTAIYFDYEGRPHHEPVLLGTLVGDAYYGAIVDERYRDFPGHWGAGPSGAESHRDFACRLVSQAHEEDRALISWSEYDFRLISEALAGRRAVLKLLEKRYVNALTLARRWGRGQTPPLHRPHTLAKYADATSYRIPHQFGEGTVGTNVARLDRRLTITTRYAELQPEERDAWRTVVKHNKHDLRATQHILRFIGAAATG